MSLYLKNTKIPGVKVTSSSLTGITLPPLNNAAAAGQVLAGYDAINASGQRFVGTIRTLTENNIAVNENTITIPAGYYATSITKTVENANSNLPPLIPNITFSEEGINQGVIIAQWEPAQSGIVQAEVYSSTYEFDTQGATVITPSEEEQTAVLQYKFTTGDITVEPIPNDYLIKEELNEQSDLIEEIFTALNNIPSGGGSGSTSSNEVITVTGRTNEDFNTIYYINETQQLDSLEISSESDSEIHALHGILISAGAPLEITNGINLGDMSLPLNGYVILMTADGHILTEPSLTASIEPGIPIIPGGSVIS